MNIIFASIEYIEYGKTVTGFPNYLYRVTKVLKEMGHNPIIVTLGNKKRYRNDNGVEIYMVKSLHIQCEDKCTSTVLNCFFDSYVINKKIHEITQNRTIDIIQFPSLLGIAILYKEKIPAVMRLSSYAKIAYSTNATLDKNLVKTLSQLI